MPRDPESMSTPNTEEPIRYSPAAPPDPAVPQSESPDKVKAADGSAPPPDFKVPVVALGASAGGLEAFERFFRVMPPASGMAFVIVQHLDPTHKSILAELIRKYTKMPVYEVTNDMPVEPNTVYVIPPNHDMAIGSGQLHLFDQSTVRGRRLPIDFFFRSLAADLGERAVAIVLSGTGTEGTLGIKAIKEREGMVMIQLPESAQYDGMPRSALATGHADYVLPPEKMPEQLIAYEQRASGIAPASPGAQPPRSAGHDLQRVLLLIRSKTGHDFSGYKQNTILRRIERRISINQLDDMGQYARFLTENPAEVETLFRELLIEVTNFFRDPDAFRVLRETVIPELFRERPVDAPVRVWVAGCATGEEAYTIAMLLRDYMDQKHIDYKVQIFATDIDRYAIETARTGCYTDSIVADVPADAFLRFFTKEGNVYQVKKSIRDMVIFAVQSVIKDPPFSKIDLITCRNLLIYLGVELQKRVLRLFHYSLRPEGYLFLGSSESVGEFTELFVPLDRKWKIYLHKSGSLQGLGNGSPLGSGISFAEDWRTGHEPKAREKISLRETAERILLGHFTPAGVLVDEKGDVLYIYGRTGKYLEPSSGEASMNIISMAREGLRLELSAALRRASTQHQEIRLYNLRVRTNGDTVLVDVTVRPLDDLASTHGLYLVAIQDHPAPAPSETSPGGEMPNEASLRIAELEQELQSAREYLRSTVEELETSNEELKSANEELQSSNEEMQSTNEELETSKEELQSVNEELITVNAELENNLEELSRSNSDLNNLLVSTDIGTIFLNDSLLVERFTPAAARFVNLIPGDVGRPLAHLVTNLEGNTLVDDARLVLESLTAREREMRTTEGRWCLVRTRPYRTAENMVRGAVVSFIDITEQKKVQEQLRAQTNVIEHTGSIVMITNPQGNIEYVNPRFTLITGYTSEEALGRNPRFLRAHEHSEAHFEQMWNTLRAGQEWRGEFHNRNKSGDLWWEAVLISPVRAADGTVTQYLFVGEDITEQRAAEVLRGVAAHFAAQLHKGDEPVAVLDFEGRIVAWNHAAGQRFGWKAAKTRKLTFRNWLPENQHEPFLKALKKMRTASQAEPLQIHYCLKEGTEVDALMSFTRLQDDSGKPFAVSLTIKPLS